jgi:hypothetical protein
MLFGGMEMCCCSLGSCDTELIILFLCFLGALFSVISVVNNTFATHVYIG